MWRWFLGFADETVPQVANVRKLIAWLASFFVAGVTVGIMWDEYIPTGPAQQAPNLTVSSAANGSRSCDVLSEISRVQATYGSQIEPVQARWLELTGKLERGDMLVSERQKVAETAKLIQHELQRLQTQHREIVTDITKACFAK